MPSPFESSHEHNSRVIIAWKKHIACTHICIVNFLSNMKNKNKENDRLSTEPQYYDSQGNLNVMCKRGTCFSRVNLEMYKTQSFFFLLQQSCHKFFILKFHDFSLTFNILKKFFEYSFDLKTIWKSLDILWREQFNITM